MGLLISKLQDWVAGGKIFGPRLNFAISFVGRQIGKLWLAQALPTSKQDLLRKGLSADGEAVPLNQMNPSILFQRSCTPNSEGHDEA